MLKGTLATATLVVSLSLAAPASAAEHSSQCSRADGARAVDAAHASS